MIEQKFDAWAIVELFGHQRIAGRVTEQAVGGCNFVRVDIPSAEHPEGFYTRLLGNGAIYAINVTDEATARVAAKQFVGRPAYAWELERAARLPAPASAGADDGGPDDLDDDAPP